MFQKHQDGQMLNWLRKLEVRRPGGPRKCFVPGSMDAFHSRVYLEKEKALGFPNLQIMNPEC